jgi:hypothetical protein
VRKPIRLSSALLSWPTLLLICVAGLTVISTLSQDAWGATSLTDGSDCSEHSLYLEPYLARKAQPSDCASCNNEAGALNQSAAVSNLTGDNSLQAIAAQGDPLSSQEPLPEACFIESMKMRPVGPSYHYATCESKTSHAKDRPALPPPCVTNALVKPVQNALAQTMSCLGIDQHEVFSLFGWESHYQVNIHNQGGIGLGQLTSIAVADVDSRQKFAEDEGKPQCKQFSSVFDEAHRDAQTIFARHGHYERANPCQFLAQPENPARNLLYAGAIYRDDKRLATELAGSLGRTPEDTDKIVVELSRYMYSMAGPGTIQKLFRLWMIRNHPHQLTYDQFKGLFRHFLANHDRMTNPKTGRSTKILQPTYTEMVDQHTLHVSQDMGNNQCTE